MIRSKNVFFLQLLLSIYKFLSEGIVPVYNVTTYLRAYQFPLSLSITGYERLFIW